MTSIYKTPDGERAAMAIYDDALNHWPVAHETLTVPTRHGNTFILASGDAAMPAVVLLHGSGGNSSMWAGDVTDYSRHFRVFAIDMPGEAGKSSPNRPDWDSPAFAEWMEDVFDGLKIERATLIGLSQGAWTALKFASAMPDRIEKLVLMAPGGVVPDRRSFIFRAIVYLTLGKWGIRRMIRALFGDQKVPETVIDRVGQVTMHFKPRLGVLPIFTDEELRRLTMPTYLIGGTKDIIRDLCKIETRLSGLVPSLTVTIIPGAGHALLNTNAWVIEFLTRD